MIDFAIGLQAAASRSLRRFGGTQWRWLQASLIAGDVADFSAIADRLISHYQQAANVWHNAHTGAMAAEIEKTLQGSASLWPARSGDSRRAFKATQIAKDDIAVRNPLRQVHILNDNQVVRGSPNPHYLAAQRTVYGDFDGIRRRAGAELRTE